MGADAGFDMVPPLPKELQWKWAEFIKIVKIHYKDDDQVDVRSNKIVFKAGEHPQLPFEGHKLLRFSSKITGDPKVEEYIDEIMEWAQIFFGSRVRYWNELYDKFGIYTWDEVFKSMDSYDQVEEVESNTIISASNSQHDDHNAIYEIKQIPGKGRGLVARSQIATGTLILSEKPLLKAEPQLLPSLELDLATKLKALPKPSIRHFLSFHNNYPSAGYPFSHTFKTNALPCGPDSSIAAVYPTICMINHSCFPNTHHSWNSATQHETIYATRPIAPGEEITISYDRGGPSSQRRSFLKESFGFECSCPLCSGSPLSLSESDTRREKIAACDEIIGDPLYMLLHPEKSLTACTLILHLLQEEYEGSAWVLVARACYDAFQICVAHGDCARAKVFAERAYRARVVCEGEESPETERVRRLMGEPEGHASFGGCSMKWRTGKGRVPRGLGEVEFEEWLFRMG